MVKFFSLILAFISIYNIYFSLEIDEAKYNLGRKFYDQKLYEEAISELGDLIDKYPYTKFYNKAVLYLAKSYDLIKDYKKELTYYLILEKKSGNDIDKKLAIFGIGNSNYKLNNWNEAALAFMDLAVKYTNSPSRPVSLYYAAKSLENLGMLSNALVVYKTLIAEYPRCSYFADSYQRAMELENKNNSKNQNKNSDIISNVVITNIINETNFSSDVHTNTINISNNIFITQNIEPFDSNYNKMEQENSKKQEEIERFKTLLELKAKLLDMKEKAIKEKSDLIYNTNK